MKFAICNETFGDWPLERALAFAAESGYTGIELAPLTLAASARELSPRSRGEIRSQIEQSGLECVGLHWLLAGTEGYHLTSPEAEVRKRTVEYLAELARLCRDLGGQILVFGSPEQRSLPAGVSQADGQGYATEVLAATSEVLAECEVTLALEPLGPQETNFLNTAEEAAALIAEVASPYCRLQLDAKALSSEAAPPAEIIRSRADLLAHFHANDPNLRGPGMGDLDFLPILRALAEVGYAGWVSVEVFDYSPGPERLARESIAYLREVCRSLINE